MYFPFSYTGEQVFYKPENFDIDLFIKQIELDVLAHKRDNDYLIFSAPFSFSGLPVTIKLSACDNNSYIHCKYHISLFENNLILLLALVFTVFFFHFGRQAFGVISVIAGLMYYLFNTAKISTDIKTLIYKHAGENCDIGTPELWKQQQQWMKDVTLCPACGEPINKYSNNCINCGLNFELEKPKINNVNSSLANGSEIIYNVIKGKK